MSNLATTTGIQQVDATLRALADPALTEEDHAAAYAVAHQVQLRINRALRGAKDALIVHMEANGLRDLGPLSVKSTAIDVAWPCNDEGNWDDAGVQEAMADLYDSPACDYLRHVPEHYEIRTAELGAAVAAGDPVARELHAELKRRGWRTDSGRRLSLTVREAKPRKEEAA